MYIERGCFPITNTIYIYAFPAVPLGLVHALRDYVCAEREAKQAPNLAKYLPSRDAFVKEESERHVLPVKDVLGVLRIVELTLS